MNNTAGMYAILIDGKVTGNLYFGLSHVLPVARRMATSRARKGSTQVVSLLNTTTGEDMAL